MPSCLPRSLGRSLALRARSRPHPRDMQAAAARAAATTYFAASDDDGDEYEDGDARNETSDATTYYVQLA